MSEVFCLASIPDADPSPERAELLRHAVRSMPLQDIDELFIDSADAAGSQQQAIDEMLQCVEDWLDLNSEDETYDLFYRPGVQCAFLVAGGLVCDSSADPPSDVFELFDRLNRIPLVYDQLREWACEDLKLREYHQPANLYIVLAERGGVTEIVITTLNEKLADARYRALVRAEGVPAAAYDTEDVVEIDGRRWKSAGEEFTILFEKRTLK